MLLVLSVCTAGFVPGPLLHAPRMAPSAALSLAALPDKPRLRPTSRSAPFMIAQLSACDPISPLARGVRRLGAALLAALSAALLAVALAATLNSASRQARPPSLMLYQPPPPITKLTANPGRADGDLSARARVVRAGRSLEVWLVTPLSVRWSRGGCLTRRCLLDVVGSTYRNL